MQKTKYDLIKNWIKKKVWNLLLGTVVALKYKYCDRSLVLIWNECHKIIFWVFFFCVCAALWQILNLNHFHITELAEILMSRVGSVLWPDLGLHKNIFPGIWQGTAEIGTSCWAVGLPRTSLGWIWLGFKRVSEHCHLEKGGSAAPASSCFHSVVVWNGFNRGCSAVELRCPSTWQWQVESAVLALPCGETEVMKLVMIASGVWVDWCQV